MIQQIVGGSSLGRWHEPAGPGPALPPADTIEARATCLPETEPDRP